MSKIFWFDCETTSLNPYKGSIHQLAFMIEINNKIVEKYNFKIAPFPGSEISKEALEISGIMDDELENFPPPEEMHKDLLKSLSKYVNKYTKTDKFILAGYNISSIDEPFLRQFFTKNCDNYFGSWFFWPKLDVQNQVAEHIAKKNLRLENYKLETVCNHFNIPIKAHDATSDIKATRTLYYLLSALNNS
jgi:DNA polymerase-3 subunit epsilon